jgi:hypothetical protein
MNQEQVDFQQKYQQVKELFTLILSRYNIDACQCTYPRFQQLVGIDCSGTGNVFKCYDTDLLIDLSRTYFNIETSMLNGECRNEKWTCKICNSTYEYGWSDFSIQIERQKLKLTYLTTQSKGKEAILPIPLHLGLIGYSYPSRSEMDYVNFADFENYMLEK